MFKMVIFHSYDYIIYQRVRTSTSSSSWLVFSQVGLALPMVPAISSHHLLPYPAPPSSHRSTLRQPSCQHHTWLDGNYRYPLIIGYSLLWQMAKLDDLLVKIVFFHGKLCKSASHFSRFILLRWRIRVGSKSTYVFCSERFTFTVQGLKILLGLPRTSARSSKCILS